MVLGVPQGGSLSDPMSKIFCMYCEYMWLSSLFDFSKISGHGEIRSCDMTPTGRATFSRHIGFTLDPADDTVLSVAVFKRYADDCRLIMAHDPSVPSGAAVSAALISLYKAGCYKDPCTLDDEERGISFPFMQGFYIFSPECRVFYTVKMLSPLLPLEHGGYEHCNISVRMLKTRLPSVLLASWANSRKSTPSLVMTNH